VGLFNIGSLFRRQRYQCRSHGRAAGRQAGSTGLLDGNGRRTRSFETLEPRQLLAADVQLGAVYFEEATGDDTQSDTIQVTFTGGVENTELTRLVIDGDKRGDGISAGDPFFDTEAGGAGSFDHVPLAVESHDGFEVVAVTVVDGGTQIAFDLQGFNAGEKLVFSIDVDETSFVPASGLIESTSVVEGGEFQRSRLAGTFVAPHYEPLELAGTFWDAFDADFNQAEQATGSALGLPDDQYAAADDLSDRTAGAVVYAGQVPLPITLEGTVFDDADLDNEQDSTEDGIAGVALGLWVYDTAAGDYVATGRTVQTDTLGDYRFDGRAGTRIPPGRYEIREVQPDGYFSVGAAEGTVAAVPRGQVAGPDRITRIDLVGGEETVGNDFAEARPASLSGTVYHDRNNDGRRDAGEEGIGNVPIRLLPVDLIDSSRAPIDILTTATGFWQATGLVPGTYRVVEREQPAAYLDGLDAAGTINGRRVGEAENPGDVIRGVRIAGGQAGVEYNFGELLPSLIAGRIHANTDGNCDLGPDDILLAGVRVDLLDDAGTLLATTFTDQEGLYAFEGLAPGRYQVREHQPEDYLDGDEHVGTAGGRIGGDDLVVDIELTSGTSARDYNFCEHVAVSLSGFVYHDRDNDSSKRPKRASVA